MERTLGAGQMLGSEPLPITSPKGSFPSPASFLYSESLILPVHFFQFLYILILLSGVVITPSGVTHCTKHCDFRSLRRSSTL